jgi:hypothetical protein
MAQRKIIARAAVEAARRRNGPCRHYCVFSMSFAGVEVEFRCLDCGMEGWQLRVALGMQL